MKSLLYFVSILFILFLSIGISYASELKIGIIDMTAVLQKAPLMISLNTELSKQFQSRQNELANAQKKLQDEKNKLSIGADTMSSEDRNKLQVNIISDQANVDILAASFQRDLTLAKNTALQKFMSKLNDAIKRVAQSEGYDLIEQTNNMLFVNSNLNITEKIIAEIK